MCGRCWRDAEGNGDVLDRLDVVCTDDREGYVGVSGDGGGRGDAGDAGAGLGKEGKGCNGEEEGAHCGWFDGVVLVEWESGDVESCLDCRK